MVASRVTAGICDLLIPLDATVERATKLAWTLSAYRRLDAVFRGKYFCLSPNPSNTVSFQPSRVLIRYRHHLGISCGWARRSPLAGVSSHACRKIAGTCACGVAAPGYYEFVSLSSHFVWTLASTCQVLLLCGRRHCGDSRQAAKMFEAVRSSLPWSACSSRPLAATGNFVIWVFAFVWCSENVRGERKSAMIYFIGFVPRIS